MGLTLAARCMYTHKKLEISKSTTRMADKKPRDGRENVA